jgi:mono/diheme cytochrome c family protein
MKKQLTAIFIMIAFSAAAVLFIRCNGGSGKQQFGGFESQVQWGGHLVSIGACSDCHTPKKMGPMGPEDDSTLFLSGHPAAQPIPDIDRAMAESKGLAVTQTLTAWVGPWGVSYSANLTPDDTGIGAWSEEQFMRAIRQGLFKGLEGSRPLLPPMPWFTYKFMTDDELKAVFAYLKSLKPVDNVVPPALPPVTAPPQ